MFKLDFEKAGEPEIKLPTFALSWKKQESSRKISTSASLTTLKPLTVCITTNCGKLFKRWEYQTTSSASWKICMQVKKQQLEPDMEQQTGSKLGKEHIKAVYCHPAYLTYMQSTSWQMLGSWSTSWNQDCWEKYQQPQICRWHQTYGRKWRRTEEPLDEGERGEWKAGLKLNLQKTKIMATGPITSWEIDGETVGTVSDFIFGGHQNHCRWLLQPWN